MKLSLIHILHHPAEDTSHAIGVISWTIINVVTGKAKEKKISPLMYVLTVLFILKYICLLYTSRCV